MNMEYGIPDYLAYKILSHKQNVSTEAIWNSILCAKGLYNSALSYSLVRQQPPAKHAQNSWKFGLSYRGFRYGILWFNMALRTFTSIWNSIFIHYYLIDQ